MSSLDFADLGAHPTLAAAIAAKGYATATSVQAAVLAAPDRDLMVSAQTGSGKTLAFGLVIGRLLLGDAERFPKASRPRALVIAPTRELAAQVQRELMWLYGKAGARVVSVTGGTNLGLDHKALRGGVDVLVGTPGRLVDLVDRKMLDLGGLQAVVLDEADEMLDLGFREALETLLSLAPSERKTLLFSATLPSGIRALAKRYQKDAIALDPRTTASGAAHEDIEHIAYLVANGERMQALANVLRMAGDDRAIVFGRTREDVAELHRQLVHRGFKATFISGERAQTERTRALEALRDSRVQVLVATNVAARGLDLPDVNLVIHADLAENAEALTHRAGRTGRAGKKGTNVFIVEERVRRKAERLFNEARLRLKFTAPPGADVVAERDRHRFGLELAELLAAVPSQAAQTLAEQLLDRHDAVQVVAALAERTLAGRPTGEKLTPVQIERAGRLPYAGGPVGPGGAPVAQGGPGGAFVPFRVSLGRDQGADPRWILPLVCGRGGISRREVGAIRVTRAFTLVEVSAHVADDFARKAAVPDRSAPEVRITREGAAGVSADTLPMRRPSGTPTRFGTRRPTPRPGGTGGKPPPRR